MASPLASILLSFLTICLLLAGARKLSVSVWISPLTFIAAQVFIGVFAKSLFLALDPAANSELRWGYEPGYLIEASVYIFMFALCVVLGYGAGSKSIRLSSVHQAAANIQLGKAEVVRLVVLCVVVTVALFGLLMVQKDSFSSIFNIADAEQFQTLQQRRVEQIEGVEGYGDSHFATTVFFNFNALLFVILTSLLYWYPVKSTQFTKIVKYSLLVCCVLIVLEVLVTGKRNLLAAYMLIYGSIALSGIRTFRFQDVAKYLAAFGGVLFIFAILTMFRNSGDDDVGLGGGAMVGAIFETLFYAEYFLSITKLTVILSQVTAETMLWGSSLVDWIVGVIPRPLWPEKPAVSLGPYVKSEIYGASGTMGGIPPTFPGELFINFMWAGLLLAPIYGYLIRQVENLCFDSRNIVKFGTHWLYFFLVLPLTYGLMQNALGGSMINTLVRVFVGWLVLIVILRVPKIYTSSRPNRVRRRGPRSYDPASRLGR